MKFSRDTVFLLILFVLLLLGMVLTLIFGGEKSHHGYGSIPKMPGNTLTEPAPGEKTAQL
jgi:hypothetical protein